MIDQQSSKRFLTGIWALISILPTTLAAQEFDERFTDWPLDLKINGRLILCDAETDLETITKLVSETDKSGKVVVLCQEDEASELKEGYEQHFQTVVVVQNLRAASEHQDASTVAWHTSAYFQSRFQYLDRQATWLKEQINTGKTAIVSGGAANWCSKHYLANDKPHPEIAHGCNLLPDCVLKTRFSSANRLPMMSVLTSQPKTVGLGLEPQTALLLAGRKLLVAGEGRARLFLPGNEMLPQRTVTIQPRSSERRQRTTEIMADLTQWRREAIDRSLEAFPVAEPRTPNVSNGTLFIVGGGGMPDGLMEDFIEAAGGKEKAKLVYVPCSEADSVGDDQRMVQYWERLGVKEATFIHTKDRNKANADPAILNKLRDATGIWFGGGRQWNFSDSYYGTEAHRLMKEVLKRGGAIGGSSAGASIQARYLCRATPIENYLPMAPGYERGGLGFISGVAIDQHFSQRKRFRDMSSLVDRYPQLLGIGIDEATAIVVRKSNATVVGRGKVHFYDRDKPVFPDQLDYQALEAGETYDLDARAVVDAPQTKSIP